MKRYTILTALLCVAFYACSDDANKSSHHCGNGALDDQEQCDGTAFAEDLSITCPENMELSQSLVCSEECTVDLEKSCVPVGPKCGDGKLDDGEQCDKTQFRENVEVNCPIDTEPAQTLVCLDACTIDLEKSCVPIEPRCGDDKLDKGEECDSSHFPEDAEINCPDGTEPAQTLVCSETCTIDLEQSCVPKCGNGVLDEGEECDQSEFQENAEISCPEKMEPAQILTCTEACTIDLEQSCVPKCGNGKLDEGEECDLNAFDDNADASCPEKYEFASKRVCTESCMIDLDQSCTPKCGNGKIDDDEACDQTSFRENVEVNCPDKYLVASTLACTDACEIDIDHSCIAPKCGDGVINDDKEECDKAQFDPEFDCGKGKHKAETLVCDETCHVDAKQSCIDDPISPIFTQFVIVSENLQTSESGRYSVYDTSLYEITNVGDGTDGSKCGVYHVNYTIKDNKPVYKATSRVWSFPESMPSGQSVVLCAAGFNKYNEENAYYTLNEYSKQFCDEILDTLQPLKYSIENDPRTEGSALAIVCGDIAEPTESAPVEVTPVEVLTPSTEYIKDGESVYSHYEFSNGMRRCDQTTPVCSLEKSINTWLPVSSLGSSYHSDEGEVLDNKFYETALFWEDMGKYECKVFKPILTQVDVESHEEDKNIFALEFMNVGLTKEPGHCALYIVKRPLGYGALYPIEKIDIPEIEPFNVWTICSASTKQTIEAMTGDAVPPIKLPCDAYIPDDKVDHAVMTNEKKAIAIYCDESVPVYAESDITNETKGVGDTSLLATFRVEGDDTIIRRIRNCNHFESELYSSETAEFSSDLIQDYSGSKYIKLLSSESDELLKKFSDDFGKYSCPLNVLDEMRCGDRKLDVDNGEDCDVVADIKINYTPSNAELFNKACQAADPTLVANLSTYPQYNHAEEWYCTTECKLNIEKSCTKCGNGVLDSGELCEITESGSIYKSLDDLKQYCQSLDMVIRPNIESQINEDKWPVCYTPSCLPLGGNICTKCGNGKLEEDEVCDGTLYNSTKCSQKCSSYHYGYHCNSPKCNADCTLDLEYTCGQIN